MFGKLRPKSEFAKNVLTLMTGTTVAQAIPIAISPILTRLYSPEEFGLYALFIAAVSILGSVASGRYELAIMLPERDEDAVNIFGLGFGIVAIFSFSLLIITLGFHDDLVRMCGNSEVGPWLYFIPLSVLFMGLFNLLKYYHTRTKQYKDLARATVLKSTVAAVVQVGSGVFKPGAGGLVSGQILSQVIAYTRLLLNFFQTGQIRKVIAFERIRILAGRYKDFPKFTLWAGLLNTLSTNLVNVLIPVLYNVHTLGYYSLAQRILGMPSSLVGAAVGQVFLQEAAIERRGFGHAKSSFQKTFLRLSVMALPSFGVLYFFIEEIFAFVFGEDWRMAGVYTKILIPFFAIRFVSSPLSTVLSVFERQKTALVVNVLILVVTVLIFFVFFVIHGEFIALLETLSVVLSVLYALFLVYYFHIAKGKR